MAPMTDRTTSAAGALPLLVATALAVACVVAACGDNVPPPPTEARSPTPAASATPLRSASSSSTMIETPGVTTFESTVYPYTLTTRAGTLLVGWHAAERAWDGKQQIDMGGPYTDRAVIASGGLFVIGAPAPDGLEGFQARFERTSVPVRGCSVGIRIKNSIGEYIGLVPSETAIPDVLPAVPGVAFTQTCEDDTMVARQALVHDGYGIGAWVVSVPGNDDAVLSTLLEQLGGLHWTTR
jgi:hypothetical protein